MKSRTGDALADDLAMDLALGRDVDDDVAVDRGRAAEAPIRGEPARVGRTPPRRLRTARGARRSEVMPCFGELAYRRA